MDDCGAAEGCDLDRRVREGDRRRILVIASATNALMFVAGFMARAAAGSAH
jgi:hypothetical protein